MNTKPGCIGALPGRLAYWRDEIGKYDEVVLIVARPGVERPTAGDQPQPSVVDVAVHHVGGEVVLRELRDPSHPEYRLAAVPARDGDPVTDFQIVKVVEDRWPIHVDMARDDCRTQLTRGRRTGEPAGWEATHRNLQRPVPLQPETDQPGINADGPDLEADRH